MNIVNVCIYLSFDLMMLANMQSTYNANKLKVKMKLYITYYRQRPSN